MEKYALEYESMMMSFALIAGHYFEDLKIN